MCINIKQMKVLANDGIAQSGIDALEKGGFEVITTKVAQNQLEHYINKHTSMLYLCEVQHKYVKN